MFQIIIYDSVDGEKSEKITCHSPRAIRSLVTVYVQDSVCPLQYYNYLKILQFYNFASYFHIHIA